MDPQMVWDAMDECEAEAAKKPDSAKSSSPEQKSTDSPSEKVKEERPTTGFFGFPFGPSSRR